MQPRYTEKALEEQSKYNLSINPEYQNYIAYYYEACERRFLQYGYHVNKDTPTRNMIKALRMMPYSNTIEEWARLHVTEAFLRSRK